MISNIMTNPSGVDAVAREMAELALQRQAGTAAQADVGIAPGNVVQLDENGRLPEVDGSRLTGLVVAEGARAETTVTSTMTTSYSSLNIAAEAFTAAPTPDPVPATNHALLAADYYGQFAPQPEGNVTLLGVDGRSYTQASKTYHFCIGGEYPSDLEAGDVLYATLLFRRVSGAGGDVKVWVQAAGQVENVVFDPTGVSTAITGGDWTDLPGTTVPTTAYDAFNKVTVVGGVAVIQLRIPINALIADGLNIAIADPNVGNVMEMAVVYLGLAPYDPFATDGSEVVLLPGATSSATLTLGTEPAPVATVDTAGTVLVLPDPPVADFREIVLDLTITGSGSLVLPTTDTFLAGATASPITASSLIAIRQKADGTVQIGAVALAEVS